MAKPASDRLYVRFAKTVIERYQKKVKYWVTFNEINCVKHHPYVSVGIIEEGHPNIEQDKYQGHTINLSPAQS